MKRYMPLLFLLLLPVASPARTWIVDKSGTGDFEILQDALDHMASGDTIRIGPGRYDDWGYYGTGETPSQTRGYIDVAEVTIIGAGEETIIGPEVHWTLEEGRLYGFESSLTASVVRLRDLTLENLEIAMMIGSGDSLFVDECRLDGCKTAVAVGTSYASIQAVDVENMLANGTGVLSHFQDRLVYRSSTSSADSNWMNTHLQVEGPSDVEVTNTRFYGGAGACILSRGPHAVFSDCDFEGQQIIGIALESGSPSCTMSDCEMRDQVKALVGSSFDGGRFQIERVLFESVSYSTLHLQYADEGYFRNCLLAAGEHGVISNQQYGTVTKQQDPEAPTHFDMRNNWWGTADRDSIASLIYDYTDHDDVFYIIDFDPYLGGPVGKENQSLDGFKALFR